MPRVVALLAAAASLLTTAPVVAQQQGYAGQQAREIKALSAQETADLLAGRGMGMARAAELNSYPGPMHVLELRDHLGLSAQQLAAIQASRERMEVGARPLGAELVERERALDEAFRVGTVTPAGMAADTEAIGVLGGRLRAIHLAAHLEMRELLTPDQIARYDERRGYASSGATPKAAAPAGSGPHHHK